MLCVFRISGMFLLFFLITISISRTQVNPETNKDDKSKLVSDSSAHKKELHGIKINYLESYTYANSSDTELTDEMKNLLMQFADFLKRNSNTTIAIIGHSDDMGTFEENTKRANKRAELAKQFLIKNGIPLSRILASGKASIDPIASNKTEAERKQNRRIEFKIVPGPPKR